MPIHVIQGINSTQLTALARGKAARESNRPEFDLRLLLAHIKILDQLEHSAAQMSSKSTIQQQKPEIQHQSECSENDDLEDLFAASTTLAAAPSLITVQEVELDDDWDS